MNRDNFEEDILISPCIDCKWKGTNKCNHCIHGDRVNPIKYFPEPKFTWGQEPRFLREMINPYVDD